MSLNVYRNVNPYYTTNYINGIHRNGDEGVDPYVSISSETEMPDEGVDPYISISSETEKPLVSNNLNKIVKPISEKELSYEQELSKHLDIFALHQRRNEAIGKLNMAFEQALENLKGTQGNLATESYELTESTEEPQPKRRKLNIARQLKNNLPVTFASKDQKRTHNVDQFRAKLQSFFPAKDLPISEAFFSNLSIDKQNMVLGWIVLFRFHNVEFLVNLIDFITKYPHHVDVCNSILETPDYYLKGGLDCSNTNASIHERVKSMRKFMNDYISSENQKHEIIYY